MIVRSTRLAAAVSTALLLLGAAACSDDGGSSAAPASSGDLTQASFFETITDAQAEVRTSHVEMTIAAGGQTITAEGDVEIGDTAADTSMSMTMRTGAAGADRLAMRLIGSAFFIDLGDKTGNQFVQVDLTDESNPIAQQFSSITEHIDPAQQLEQFRTAVSSVQKKGGPETIDGVEAQPYEVVLDTSKIPSFSDVPSAPGVSIPATLTYTMYVGPDDLLRRVSADVSGSTVVVDYSAWGDDVDIEKPSADEISDADLAQLGLA